MENISEKHVLPTKILLLEPKPEEKTTNSGLILPNVIRPTTSVGSAVLVGENAKPIEAGNKIMFSPHAGIKVKFEDEEYTLIGIIDVFFYW